MLRPSAVDIPYVRLRRTLPIINEFIFNEIFFLKIGVGLEPGTAGSRTKALSVTPSAHLENVCVELVYECAFAYFFIPELFRGKIRVRVPELYPLPYS